MLVSEERHEVEDEFDSDDLDELVEEEFDSLSSKPEIEQNSILQKIRRFFFKTVSEKRSENRTRMYLLTQAIETYPDAAVNHLLRGELYLKIRERELAQQDFEKALELAEAQFDNDRWGLGSQALQDRARRGLQRIGR